MGDTLVQILNLIKEYGFDYVFMAILLILYVRGQRYMNIIQEKRVEDGKQAIAALLEAKHAITQLLRMERKLDKLYEKALRNEIREEEDEEEETG